MIFSDADLLAIEPIYLLFAILFVLYVANKLKIFDKITAVNKISNQEETKQIVKIKNEEIEKTLKDVIESRNVIIEMKINSLERSINSNCINCNIEIKRIVDDIKTMKINISESENQINLIKNILAVNEEKLKNIQEKLSTLNKDVHIIKNNHKDPLNLN